jgi:hypothetical protein
LYQCPVHFLAVTFIILFSTQAALQRRSGSTKKGERAVFLLRYFKSRRIFYPLGDSYNSHRADRALGGRESGEQQWLIDNTPPRVFVGGNVTQVDCRLHLFITTTTHIPTSNGRWGPNLGEKKARVTANS